MSLERLRRTLAADSGSYGPLLTASERACMTVILGSLEHAADLRADLASHGDHAADRERRANYDPSWCRDGWRFLRDLARLAPSLDRPTVEAHWLTRYGVLPSDAGVLGGDRRRYVELIASGAYSADLDLMIPVARDSWQPFAPRGAA